MAQVQIADVVIPEEFTAYQVESSLVSTALSQSGVVANNGLIEAQLQAGAESFNIPFWADLSDTEADITSDDPTVPSTPLKIGASKQVVRKSYLHQSWSEMSLACELSGDSALARIQDRVSAYWDRQMEKRLISTLPGVLASFGLEFGFVPLGLAKPVRGLSPALRRQRPIRTASGNLVDASGQPVLCDASSVGCGWIASALFVVTMVGRLRWVGWLGTLLCCFLSWFPR